MHEARISHSSIVLTGAVRTAGRAENANEALDRQARRMESSCRELQEGVATFSVPSAQAQQISSRLMLENERPDTQLVKVLDALPGAVIVIDGDGIIRECNCKSVEFLNLPLLSCAWSVVVKREFCRGASRDGELKLKNGRWLSLSRQPIEAGSGEVLLLADVTDSRRMSDLLRRNERLQSIGEMTTRLGHQIRTPLASALLHASRLGETDSPKQRAIADKIKNRLHDLSYIVDDMLRFVTGESAPGTQVRVEDLLNGVVEAISPQLSKSGLIRLEISDPGLVISGNREALAGALLNLVNNALQACRQKPVVELGAVRSGQNICLTVTDNGPGIGAQIRSRIFEPFFTTRPQGTGLGLAVVRSVAESHGGEVLVDSGLRGSTFSICIPSPPIAATVVENQTTEAPETCNV